MTTQEVLQQCTVDGNIVRLPDVTLDRKEYLEVAKKLELIGGKWKGGKTKGFVFEEDPTELLADIANGDDRNLKKEFQFFPTPKEVSDIMVQYLPEMKDGMKFLEPSAGDGALIRAMFDCYELMDLNRKKLERIQDVNIAGWDFFTCNQNNYYDVVFANPPFTKNLDIDHIRKMYDVCKPGGIVITLASPSWTFGSKTKQVEFREWLDKIGAGKIEIDEGAFNASGTTIRTLLLIINKPTLNENFLSVGEFIAAGQFQMEQTSHYSDEDLEIFKGNINKKLDSATKELEYLRGLVDKEDPENKFEKDQLEQIITRQETFIDHLNKALERIADKSYGICRVTGKLIDKARLLAVPHATLSLETKLGTQQQPEEPVAQPEKKSKKPRVKKGEKAPDVIRYSDEDLRNFKTLISNKIDAAKEEIKFLKVVHMDRQRGIKVEDYEDMPPAEVENLIKWQEEFVIELEDRLERIKKKTYGIDDHTGKLIPKPVLLESLTVTAYADSSRKCRVCGCTDADCRQCIEKTGQPCHWVEEDLCSACVENGKTEVETLVQEINDSSPTVEQEQPVPEEIIPSNDNNMNFFQLLAQACAQSTDLTLRIMQKDTKLTINIMPGSKSVTIKPIIVTGTPQELDNEFFKTIAPGISEIKGLVTNLEDVKKDLQKLKDDKPAAKQEKPQTSHKPATKKQEKKPEKKENKPAVEEPNIFA